MLETSQGAPSTIRCIETTYCNLFKRKFVGRGAPSTIRCIKTRSRWAPASSPRPRVREHPASSGALRLVLGAHGLGLVDLRQGAPSTIRCIKTAASHGRSRARRGSVRERPAPSGALRQVLRSPRGPPRLGQGAPSTIRCIKTRRKWGPPASLFQAVRERPAPSGALRRRSLAYLCDTDFRQGAPSTIRCIETLLDALDYRFVVDRQGAPSTIRCIETRRW